MCCLVWAIACLVGSDRCVWSRRGKMVSLEDGRNLRKPCSSAVSSTTNLISSHTGVIRGLRIYYAIVY
jgi:hypothetical protein